MIFCFPLRRACASSAALLFALGVFSARAEPIRHPTAVFAGLDKTTGRIINFDVAVDETVQFGTLQVTPKVCNTRPQTETPQTTSFVEVDDQTLKPEPRRDGRPEPKTEPKAEIKRIFSGWMFAASPGLHGVEHPVYDVWLVDCKGGKELAAQPAAATPPAAEQAPPDAPEAARPEGKKKRTRKVEPTAPAPVEAQPIGPAPLTAEPMSDAERPPGPAQPDIGSEPPKPKKKRKPRSEPAAAPVDDSPFLRP